MDKNKTQELINLAHDSITRIKGKDYAPSAHEIQAWIDNYLNNETNIDEAGEKYQNVALDKLKKVGGFENLPDIDKLALLGGSDDERLKSLDLNKIFKENGGTFGKFEIEVRIKDKNQQPIKHAFSQEFAGKEGYLFPYINYDDNNQPYVTVRFDEFVGNLDNFGGGNYEERPIFLANIYPIDYDEIKSDFVNYQNKTDFERDEFRKYFDGDLDEAKKTDFSKEKSQGLHGWFARRGGGGSSGWVDCNTCRKDPETGRKKCKPCGRQDGEKRKYPACRPTPASCGTRGKGKKWGKKSNNENENKNEMKDLITKKLHEMVEEGHGEFQNYMFFNNLKTIRDAIDEILQMDAHAVDQLLSDGHNWATDHMATSADDIEEVYHFLNATLDEHEPDSYHGETPVGYEDEYGNVEDGMSMMNEAEYKGRKVQLGKPTRGDVKKYKVFVKNAKGKVVKVNFGDKNMEIKRDNPKRRKSFRARHKCAQAKDRTTPKYWSCRMWSKKPVSKIVGENFGGFENSRIFVKNENMTQPATKPLVPETKPRTSPNQPVKPSRKDKPFLPEVAPGIKTDPKAMNEGKFDFETYHKTLASALEEIEKYAMVRGFDSIEFGPFDVEHIAYGDTKVMHIDLNKNGMPVRKKLQVQIYRMDGGTYELNMYVG